MYCKFTIYSCIYNVVLEVYNTCDSATHTCIYYIYLYKIYIYILFVILFHYRLLWDVEYISLCFTGPCCLSVLKIAETPILWPPAVKNWLIGKDPDAEKDWRQVEKGMTEDKTVGWHHQPDGYEFEQAPGVGDEQGSLACCSPWDRKELDMTEQLNGKIVYVC